MEYLGGNESCMRSGGWVRALMRQTPQSSLSFSVYHVGGHREKGAVCKPGRGLSSETDHAHTLNVGFQPLEL